MFIVKYYLAGTVIAFLSIFAIQSIYFQLLFCWIGISLLLVSLAYIYKQPRIFRKKVNGTIPAYVRWLFIPYLIGVQIYNAWARKNDKVPAIQEVTSNLYLACRLFPSDVSTLQENKVNAILDVTAEFDGLDWTAQSEDLDYLNIPVLDHQSPSTTDLVEAIHWIDNHLSKDNGVVVHCALGRGRSVLVMAAYLLSKDNDLDVEGAIEKIQGKRATAALNKYQKKALEKAHASGALRIQNKLAIIANPVAGGGKWPENKDEVIEWLSPHFDLQVLETTEEISAEQLTKQAINKGIKQIIACGGDGTVTEVASQLINTSLTLGIIPMGTANALSHVLYGNSSKITPVSTACEAIIAANVMQIDTATCNDEIMLLVTALGFEQQMINSADREQKNMGGQFAYITGFLQAVSSNQTIKIDVSFDSGQKQTIETGSFVVANAAPFTTILAQGNGEPNYSDGRLDITWLRKMENSSQHAISLAQLAIGGMSGDTENIEHTHAQKVEINAESELDYVVDGENRKAQSICISILPKSLRVIIPTDE